MNDGQARLARALTYAGILPPWLGLVLHLAVAPAWAGFAVVAYGAIIASFVCGMHWGIALRPVANIPVNLLLTSNAGALAAWLLVLVALWSIPFACIGLVVVLALLLLIDHLLLAAAVLQPWFWTVRRNASLCLGAGLILWSIVA